MYENKTKPTKKGARTFLQSIKDPARKVDALALLKLFEDATKEKAVMWGNIVGFGTYSYVYSSGRKGDWPMTAFAVRANALTVYLMPGVRQYPKLLAQLGTYKVSGGSCLYIKKLADVDTIVLKKLISVAYADMRKKYPRRSI